MKSVMAGYILKMEVCREIHGNLALRGFPRIRDEQGVNFEYTVHTWEEV